jgi:hypothetical protein
LPESAMRPKLPSDEIPISWGEASWAFVPIPFTEPYVEPTRVVTEIVEISMRRIW